MIGPSTDLRELAFIRQRCMDSRDKALAKLHIGLFLGKMNNPTCRIWLTPWFIAEYHTGGNGATLARNVGCFFIGKAPRFKDLARAALPVSGCRSLPTGVF